MPTPQSALVSSDPIQVYAIHPGVWEAAITTYNRQPPHSSFLAFYVSFYMIQVGGTFILPAEFVL